MSDYYEWKISKEKKIWHDRISDLAMEKTRLQKGSFILGGIFLIISILLASLNPAAVALVCFAAAFSLFGVGLEAGRTAAVSIAEDYGLPRMAWKDLFFITPRNFDTRLAVAAARVGVIGVRKEEERNDSFNTYLNSYLDSNSDEESEPALPDSPITSPVPKQPAANDRTKLTSSVGVGGSEKAITLVPLDDESLVESLHES